LVIEHGNELSLREPLPNGEPRHWILEVHFVDRERGYGAFCEELLTIRGPRPVRSALDLLPSDGGVDRRLCGLQTSRIKTTGC
jgi:hypothetical protein